MYHQTLHNKIHSEQGISRLLFLAIVVAAVLALIVLGVPLYHYIVDRSDAYGCGSALATANAQLRIYSLTVRGNPTEEEARAEVTRAMDGWNDLCPGGGDCYLVENDEEEVPYIVVCALHDDDPDEAGELNARSALAQIEAAQSDPTAPADLTVTLNSQKFTAVSDPTETVISPTHKTLQKAGGALISYYAEDDIVTWFCYADQNYVRVWALDQVNTVDSVDGWIVRVS